MGTTGTKLKIRIAGHKHDQIYGNFNLAQGTALSWLVLLNEMLN